MIEIIRDEKETDTKEGGLPKEIRQIGNADVGDRIYLEEKAHRYLHERTGWDVPVFGEGRKVFVLLGKIEDYAGQKCVFVEEAIEIEDITYLDGVPVWNDKTWSDVFLKMKKQSEERIVVGWAMDIKDCPPGLTERLIGVHLTHFGGKHQLMFLLDSMEKEENFYCSRQGRMRKREGFYLYHDKRVLASVKEGAPKPAVTIEHATVEDDLERIFWEKEKPKQGESLKNSPNSSPAQPLEAGKFRAQEQHEENFRSEAHQAGKFRAQMQQAEEKEGGFHFSPSYLLAAIALVLVVAAYQNNSQIKSLSETISQMNVAQTMFGDTEETESGTGTEVQVEQLSGNLEKSENQTAESGDAAATEGATGAASGSASGTATGTTSGTAEGAATGTTSGTAEGAATEMTSGTTAGGAATGGAASETTSGAAAGATTQSEAAQTAASDTSSYLSQGYYIVQKGDNLEGICMKVYQTTAMLDKVCEVNGIENSDAIYEGQCLTLPK